MATKNKKKYLIIGAGISGLTFAFFAKKDYLILEKDNNYGGYCKTFNSSKGFIWDYAGHFYHFKTDFFKKMFLEMVSKEELIQKEKFTKIYYNNKLIDFPFQMNIHQLPKQEFIDCLYDLFNKEEKQIYEDFLDMLYSKFGKSITNKFLKPYNEKLYATDLKKLDTDAMGRFFPYADKEEIIQNMKKTISKSYNSEFLYLKKGTQYFIDKIYEKLDKTSILFNKNVYKVNQKEKYVVTSDGEKYYYENLINTIPLDNFFKILNYNDELFKEMSSNKVLVFNIGFSKPQKKYKKEHWVYFPSSDTNFYRVGFYNNILNQSKLSIYVEIGFKKETKLNIEKEYLKTLEGLKRVGIFDKYNSILDYNYVIMDPAYVHINSKTTKKIEERMLSLNKNKIYTLGRYGKWTYNSMEDSMQWAKELIEKL